MYLPVAQLGCHQTKNLDLNAIPKVFNRITRAKLDVNLNLVIAYLVVGVYNQV